MPTDPRLDSVLKELAHVRQALDRQQHTLEGLRASDGVGFPGNFRAHSKLQRARLRGRTSWKMRSASYHGDFLCAARGGTKSYLKVASLNSNEVFFEVVPLIFGLLTVTVKTFCQERSQPSAQDCPRTSCLVERSLPIIQNLKREKIPVISVRRSHATTA